jgi:LacI family repressor for deo operon, udp, cdd, tsx, nupC, and nupG
MKPKKRVTIYDIARKLGLTASSVSRALNNSSHVNEVTKQLIVKTAAEMNYKPNTMAANLRKGKSQTIGVVVPRINQNFFANIIAGIEETTYQRGYNLVICQSNELHNKEIQCVNTLINQHVDCIVISVAADGSDYSHLQNVIDHNIQLIQFDRVAESLDTLKVINDNEQASANAVTHMIKQGYQRIALLEGPQNLNVFRERKAGYIKALQQHGLPVIDELIIPNNWEKKAGTEKVRALLSLPNPPDAIFASRDDFSALGVLEVATGMGLKVPGQLGICGFSNEAFTEITSPSITTVDQHSVYMGNTIANLYFQEMDNADADTARESKTISIESELIIRSSTGK